MPVSQLNPFIFPCMTRANLVIRRMAEADLLQVAQIHAQAFPRQQHSEEWIACNWRAYPRMQYFVAQHEEWILGFLHWTQKSGFRSEVVLELEQIAVDSARQGQGKGESLIRTSLPVVMEQLAERGARLKSILVTTRMDNGAQRLYRRVLGAEVEAVIPGLYSADEAILRAHNSLPRLIKGLHRNAGAS